MTLRGDIRQYFEREAAVYPAPAGLRAAIASGPAGGVAPQRAGLALAAVVAAGLAFALVAGLVGVGVFRHLNTPVPVQSGQHGIVLDADSVDGSNGWALTAGCNPIDATVTATCPYWVETTHDGGRTWIDPVKVASYQITDGDAPRHIHFADRRNGFVYGNAVALATHDGGHTWSRILTAATGVVAIDGRGPVWAVIYSCGKGTGCGYQVFISTDLGMTWKPATALPDQFSPRYVVPFGSEGLILTSFGGGDMAVTRDSGRTWSLIAGRCPATAAENEVATPDGTEIWQYCGRLPAVQSTVHGGDFVAVSEDGGRTWRSSYSIPVMTAGATLFSPGRGTAFMIPTGGAQLLVSSDAGQSWQTVDGSGEFGSIAFAGDVVWAVDNRYLIWSSNDGGFTWTKLAAQP